MIRILFIIAALALFVQSSQPTFAQTGSQKTPAALATETNALWPDQSNGQITPYTSRQTLLDIIASYIPLNPGTPIKFSTDIYFGAQAPFCDPIALGAVPDGVTNSLAAFNACLTALGGAGGTIWLDAQQGIGATFCLKASSEATVFNVSAPIRILSSSPDISLSSCGSGFSVLQVTAPSILDGFYIIGPGYDGESGFGASEPALLLASGANGTKLYNLIVYGGAPTIQWNCAECQAYNVNGAFAYVNGSGIAAEWYFAHGGGELYNVSGDDNEYPYGIPTPPFTYTAWTTTQSVATNAVETATCQDGNSYVIQAKIGGTTASSGSGPICKNYGGAGQTFTDGTVTWSLSHPALLYHWQFDTGSTDVHIHQADTGGGNVGFGLTNTQSGAAPSSITCVTCNGGNSYTAQVYGLASGGDIRFVSDNFGGCLKTGCYVMDFESTFAGGTQITGGNANQGFGNGIKIAGGSGYLITGANLTGNITALAISGSASQITAIGNNVTGATTGVAISGTSSEIVFTNNVGCVNGSTSCVSKSSSGANIITSPNDDGNAYSLLVGGTKISGCGTGNVPFNNAGVIGCNGQFTTDGSGNTVTSTLALGGASIGSNVLAFTGSAAFNLGSDATGDMYYRNSGGNVARLPVCTGTQVIGAAGGIPACVTQGGGGGANTYLCTITASSSAVLSYASPTTGTCTINSSYTSYLLLFQNIIPATDSKILEFQVHSGGSFKSSGYVISINIGGGGSIGNANSGSATYIPLSDPLDSNNLSLHNTAPGLSGSVIITNPSVSGLITVSGQVSYLGAGGASYFATGTTSGYWATPGVVDGFQVLMDSGNITSGSILVYGVQ
jgi:hypothetical protein